MLSANNQPSDLIISRQDGIWHHWTFQNRRRRKDEPVQPLCQGSASILQLCQERGWHVSKVLRVTRKNWRIIEIQFRFLRGNCPFSALSCPYSHNKDQAPLCLRWKAGECTGAMGNKCVYRQVVDRCHVLLRYQFPLAGIIIWRGMPAQQPPKGWPSPRWSKPTFPLPTKWRSARRSWCTGGRRWTSRPAGGEAGWRRRRGRSMTSLVTPQWKLCHCPKEKCKNLKAFRGANLSGAALLQCWALPPCGQVPASLPIQPVSAHTTPLLPPLPLGLHQEGEEESMPLCPQVTLLLHRWVVTNNKTRKEIISVRLVQATPPASLVPVATETPIATGQCPVCLR